MTKMTDIEKAWQLIRDVILVQSNVFIKEFLLSKELRGGTTKADFQEQLDNAIESGTITYEELKAWVDETEGWGDEHIYLYKIPTPVERLLRDRQYAELRVRKAGFEKVWAADTSLEFPSARKLTAIQFAEGELTFVWHQGTQFEKRAKDKDFQRFENDGEQYLYKAWRIASRRNVTRIVIRPNLAAVFLPSALEPKSHGDERVSIMKEVASVIAMRDWPVYSMGEAIKVLDSMSMKAVAKRRLRARHTRLSAKGGGWVDFGSDTDESYGDIDALREVRGAVRPEKFRGLGGEFEFLFPASDHRGDANEPQIQPVKFQLYGDHDRIRIWARLTRAGVWTIIRKLPKRGAR